MREVAHIVVIMLILVGIYLFLSKGSVTVQIIKTIAENSIAGLRTLQGR